MEPAGLSIVIPAYNESRSLPSLCARVAEVLKPSGIRYKLFIVDDGSKDGTAEVARGLAAEHPIEVLVHPVNRGLSGVFLTGLRAATAGAREDDAVAVMEGDGTSDPAVLGALLKSLEAGCDVAIASRHVPGGCYRNFPFKRLILSRGANALLRLVCRVPGVRDYTIFYRAYRAGPLRRALEAYGDRFTSVGGFACNAEMLLRLTPFIGKVGEVPFVYDYGRKPGRSSMKIPNNLLSYLTLFKILFLEIRRTPPTS